VIFKVHISLPLLNVFSLKPNLVQGHWPILLQNSSKISDSLFSEKKVAKVLKNELSQWSPQNLGLGPIGRVMQYQLARILALET